MPPLAEVSVCAGLDAVELAERHRVAGLGRGELRLVLAEHPVDAGDLGGVVGRQPELGAVGDGARQDARDRQLAAMRGVDRSSSPARRRRCRPATPSRLRVASTSGASWRIAFSSRSTPLPFSAVPISTGVTEPSRRSAARSSNTSSRGGSFSSSKLLHQQVVMVGQRFQHREARLDLARLLVAGNLGRPRSRRIRARYRRAPARGRSSR